MPDLPGRTPGSQPVTLAWRTTRPDKEQVYVGLDAKAEVGRVHGSGTAYGHLWQWFGWFPPFPNSGREPSRREAFLALEARYNAWRAKQPPAD